MKVIGEQERLEARAAFDVVWEHMEIRGLCDGWGGMQYRRIWDEFDKAGYPANIAAFIGERAND